MSKISRVFVLGEEPIQIQHKKKDNKVDTSDMVQIKEYIDNMSKEEKKEYIKFLVTKAEQERGILLENVEIFNKSCEKLAVLGSVFNSHKIVELYDEIIIPTIKGTYTASSVEEYESLKLIKKDIITELTKAYFKEFMENK